MKRNAEKEQKLNTRIIAVINNKGGVGKTHLASIYAEYESITNNKKVLLIGLDGQCNIDQRYLEMDDSEESFIPPIHPDYNPEVDNDTGRYSIADIFYDDEPAICPYPTFIPNLDILPASGRKLIDAEKVREEEIADKVYDRFYRLLTNPELQEEYDVIVIDTGPSKGPLTMGAIKVSTDVIIASVMEDKPIQGTSVMYRVWLKERANKLRAWPLRLAGIVINKFDTRTALHKDLESGLKQNKEISPYILDAKFHQRIIYAETDNKGANPKSIFHYPDKEIAKKESMNVCKELSGRIFNNG